MIWKLNKGTGTNQIATEGEAAKVGISLVPSEPSKGCTKSRAIALKCNVAGSYDSNQLVKYSDLSRNIVVNTYKFTLTGLIEDSNYALANKQTLTGSTLQRFILSTMGSTITLTWRSDTGLSVNDANSSSGTVNLKPFATVYGFRVLSQSSFQFKNSIQLKNSDQSLSLA